MIHRSASSRRRRASRSAASSPHRNRRPSTIPAGGGEPRARRASIAVPQDASPTEFVTITAADDDSDQDYDPSPRGSLIPGMDLSPRRSLTPDIFNAGPRSGLTPEYNKSPRNSITPETARGSRTNLLPDPQGYSRSPRNSLCPDLEHFSRSRTSLIPEDFNRSPRNSLVPEYNRSARNSLVPDVSPSRSHRNSLVGETSPNRSPRGSIAPDPGRSPRGSISAESCRSPRGSICPEMMNRSPRGSICPDPNRSPRGSLIPEPNRSPRGSIASDTTFNRSPRNSLPLQESPNHRSPRGSIGSGSLQDSRSPRGSVDIHLPGRTNRSPSPYRNTGRNQNTGEPGSRRASSSVSQVSGDDRRHLCEHSKLNADSSSVAAYGSVVYQLNHANLEATGTCDFLARALGIVYRTVVVTVALICLTALPIVMFIMGVQFVRDCPKEPRIPIYMIVGGSFGTVKVLWLLWRQVRSRRFEQRQQRGVAPALSVPSRVADMLLTLFLVVWFLCGNCWIFGIYWPQFEPELYDPNNWCDKTLFIFALVHLGVLYIILGVVLSMSVIFLLCQLYNSLFVS